MKITIIGGGPVGLFTAIMLLKLDYEVILIDEYTNLTTRLDKSNNNSHKTLALSISSYQLLKMIDIDIRDSVYTTSIKQVHISQSGFGAHKLKAAQYHLSEFGYTINYANLLNLLLDKLSIYQKKLQIINHRVIKYNQDNNVVHILCDNNIQINSDLLILASGDHTFNNIKYNIQDYKQTAVIGKLYTNKSHTNIAYEHFANNYALILLPYFDYYNTIFITQNNNTAYDLNNYCKQQYQDTLNNSNFMKRFGAYSIDKQTNLFTLKLQTAISNIDNVVLIGNAKQSIHPIFAQGLNLGFRDASELCYQIINHCNTNNYNQLRVYDSKFVINFTNTIANLINISSIIAKPIYFTAFGLLNSCDYLKNTLVKSLIFGL